MVVNKPIIPSGSLTSADVEYLADFEDEKYLSLSHKIARVGIVDVPFWVFSRAAGIRNTSLHSAIVKGAYSNRSRAGKDDFQEVLLSILRWENYSVTSSIVLNNVLTEKNQIKAVDIILSIRDDKTRELLILDATRTLYPEVVEKIFSYRNMLSKNTWAGLARNLNAPAKILDTLLLSGTPAVKAAVSDNPNVNKSLLADEFAKHPLDFERNVLVSLSSSPDAYSYYERILIQWGVLGQGSVDMPLPMLESAAQEYYNQLVRKDRVRRSKPDLY